ncbi:MAG TPA: hypothetical protein VGO03_15505 [Acidimicrobiia bacterium]
MPNDFSRRDFLGWAGGVALAGVGGSALLAACGGGSNRASPTTLSPLAVTPEVVSSDLYASPIPQRLAFTVLSATTADPDAGKPARVALAAPGGGALTPFVHATPRAKGLGTFRGIYTIDATLGKAGSWNALVDYAGQKLSLGFEVAKTAQAVTIGEPAPLAASPTVAHPLGVTRVCTRTPACPLHTKSLSTLIGKGRPVVLLFATPAYCQTHYCGQVLDALLPLVPQYSAKADFVHCEIYQSGPTGPEISTVTAWSLPSEPWFFAIDAEGTVRARLDGAFDQDEMRAAIAALTA